MPSTRPPWQLEERARNHRKPVPNTILAIMRPGCLILTDTILRSSIKARRVAQRIVPSLGISPQSANEKTFPLIKIQRHAEVAQVPLSGTWVLALVHPQTRRVAGYSPSPITSHLTISRTNKRYRCRGAQRTPAILQFAGGGGEECGEQLMGLVEGKGEAEEVGAAGV